MEVGGQSCVLEARRVRVVRWSTEKVGCARDQERQGK